MNLTYIAVGLVILVAGGVTTNLAKDPPSANLGMASCFLGALIAGSAILYRILS